jgi:tetratricopeptide (TPR) repeat protein
MGEEVGCALLPLAILYEMLGWWREGQQAFGAAVDGLGAKLRQVNQVTGEERVVMGALLATHGTFCVRTGAFDQARVQLQASLEALRQVPDCRRETAFPHLGLGLLAHSEGRSDEAEAHFRCSLPILRAADDPLLTAFTLDYLGEICAEVGKQGEARQLLQEALASHRERGEQWGVGRALYGLGRVAAGLGEHAEAKRWLGESLAVFSALGARVPAARARSALGEVAYATEEYARARHLLEESLPVLEGSQNSVMAARCLVALGRVARAFGQYEPADAYFRGALELVGKLGTHALAQDALAGLAELQTRTRVDEYVAESAPSQVLLYPT